MKEIERMVQALTRDLKASMNQAYISGIDDGKKSLSRVWSLIQTIKANVNNEKLSDADFREFIKNAVM